jgi:hypothetical protein
MRLRDHSEAAFGLEEIAQRLSKQSMVICDKHANFTGHDHLPSRAADMQAVADVNDPVNPMPNQPDPVYTESARPRIRPNRPDPAHHILPKGNI